MSKKIEKTMRIDRIELIAEMSRQGIKTRELADRAGLPRSIVTALRRGKAPTYGSVYLVAKVLGVPVEYLLENKGE